MRRAILIAASALSLTACSHDVERALDFGGNQKFMRAVYDYRTPYEYDQDSQLPILQARNTDPGRHWNNAFRGRNWR